MPIWLYNWFLGTCLGAWVKSWLVLLLWLPQNPQHLSSHFMHVDCMRDLINSFNYGFEIPRGEQLVGTDGGRRISTDSDKGEETKLRSLCSPESDRLRVGWMRSESNGVGQSFQRTAEERARESERGGIDRRRSHCLAVIFSSCWLEEEDEYDFSFCCFYLIQQQSFEFS